MNEDIILLGHGSGGQLTHQLISNLFHKHFKNEKLNIESDSALLGNFNYLVFTTDSYVVDPLFFPGGDIGKLAVSGTVNDLSVAGAKPKYLSAGFIIEEGFSIASLETIVISMADEAKKAGVYFVTGDTKVVKKGQCDKLFINTAGVGEFNSMLTSLNKPNSLMEGDVLILNGTLGDHAISILGARENLQFEKAVLSDVCPLNHLIETAAENFGSGIKLMRDITRGGLATIVNEICKNSQKGINLDEQKIPVKSEVQGICELYGYDPLYLANEGKLLIIVEKEMASGLLEVIKMHPYGKQAAIIGELTNEHPGRAILKSAIGGSRIVDMLAGEMLPRIC